MISMGKYPHVTLKQARDKQREFHELLEQSINPSAKRQLKKIEEKTIPYSKVSL